MSSSLKPQYRSILSTRWHTYASDVIPVWIADMDYAAPESIKKVLHDFVAGGDFGYTYVIDAFYKSVLSWFKSRHAFLLQPHHVIPISGVVCAIHLLLEAWLGRGEEYLTFTPAYPQFFQPRNNQNIPLVEVPLTYENQEPVVDFKALSTCIHAQTKVILISNPHNPTGKVWTKEELKELIDICERYDLMLISDDIWCDLTTGTKHYHSVLQCHPRAMKRAVTITSPAKTFNVPALNCAYIIALDDHLNRYIRKKIYAISPPVTPFSVLCAIEAYNHCHAWLKATRQKIQQTKQWVEALFRKQYAPYTIHFSEATFLLWIDFSALKGKISGTPYDFFLKEAKIAFNEGRLFGKGYDHHLRLNYACEENTLKEVFKRMDKALKKL